jgi:hypothetical protein
MIRIINRTKYKSLIKKKYLIDIGSIARANKKVHGIAQSESIAGTGNNPQRQDPH